MVDDRKVVPFRRYRGKKEQETHVMHERGAVQRIWECPTCGPLQMIDDVIIHHRPLEEHDDSDWG